MFMLWIWWTVWVLRVLIDNLPSSVVPKPPAILDGLVSRVSSPLSSSSLLLEGFPSGLDVDTSTKALGRALSHVKSQQARESTSLQWPWRSRSWTRTPRTETKQYKKSTARPSLPPSCAPPTFSTTPSTACTTCHPNNNATWPSLVFHALPLGGHLIFYLKGILGSMFSSPADSDTWSSGEEECILAEKLTQEQAWMVKKMRACSIAEEAIRQWSSASDLASLSIFCESQGSRTEDPSLKLQMRHLTPL
ncbi:hypothetical protein AAC387_Pa11g1573 [Persea americana]